MIEVRMMPMDQIVVTNPYLRLDTQIKELKKSIAAIGLIHPLIVNQNNELLAGGRRYTACTDLGFTEVPVVIVEHSKLEQELISIDENLIRLPLQGVPLEQALNRGRDIYETLYPEAKKVETTVEGLKPMIGRPAASEEEVEEEKVDGKASYVEVTAQKTGLSEGIIRSAIIRDELSSEQVKEARELGSLGASQTNEIVKLSKEDQDKILPLATELSTKKLREVVTKAKEEGVDKAIEHVMQEEPMPKEYEQLLSVAKRFNKLCSKVVTENLACASRHRLILVKLLEQSQDLLPSVLGINQRREEPAPAPEPEENFPTSLL